MTKPSLALALGAVAASCYTPAPSRIPPAPPIAPAQRAAARDVAATADLCPLGVPRSRVAAEDVEGGGALTFTTAHGDVADIRRRVRAMADLHDLNRTTLARVLRWQTTLHAAQRYVEDVPDGARIVFRPPHDEDLRAYRGDLVREAVRLRAGQCPMIMPVRSPAPAGQDDSQLATASR